MNQERRELRNGEQSVTFIDSGRGFRPEWFRAGGRPMLRFKDHEWLNIGAERVVSGALEAQDDRALLFGGKVTFAGTAVRWSVRVALPADGGAGFTITTALIPQDEDIEVLEALSSFELPYEYDGTEHGTTLISQQPFYRYEGEKQLNGAGFMQPLWYYGRVGRAHLTYQSATPLLVHRIQNADGGNARWTMLLGNWDVCTSKDVYTQPTRNLSGDATDAPVFPDAALQIKAGRRGTKFLMGAVNWSNSLHKDPNILVEAKSGLRQELTVDFAGAPPGGTQDAWAMSGWERVARIHLPASGRVPAFEVARARGASWPAAAQWLAEQFVKPEGCPGLFNIESGSTVYAPHTRPKWDNGIPFFTGQFSGPLAYLGTVWNDDAILKAAQQTEDYFVKDTAHAPEVMWTIGPTPMYVSALRKLKLVGGTPETMRKVEDYIRRRAAYVANPPADAKRGDGGIFAWEAYTNLLAADVFDRKHHEGLAREFLERVNAKLDADFWTFNCAAENDLVGAGQSRPFGHAIAATANVLAWQRFEDPKYLKAAERFRNLLLSMHFIAYNESPSPDLDTRGWAHGSTGGRDQLAQLPPWETGHALLQLGYLLGAGLGRAGVYDVLWLHSRTGLAQFPKARSLKRIFKPDMTVTYRPIESLASEREFYLKFPYLAYENPWDQTMLAPYQGVEPILLSLFYGGGIAAATDDRVLAVVPEVPQFSASVAKTFTVELWNPLAETVSTRVRATIAQKRGTAYRYSGAMSGRVTPQSPETENIVVPSRSALKLTFTADAE